MDHGRHLETKGLPAPCGEKGKGILSAQHRINDLFLYREEGAIMPVLA